MAEKKTRPTSPGTKASGPGPRTPSRSRSGIVRNRLSDGTTVEPRWPWVRLTVPRDQLSREAEMVGLVAQALTVDRKVPDSAARNVLVSQRHHRAGTVVDWLRTLVRIQVRKQAQDQDRDNE